MTKSTKSESNRTNALKSTGPKSAVGKAASAQNSIRHGVLSSHLILPNESREEFDALQAELQQEFMPQGVLEMSLVERIAIALWRQRRLVRAESAEIELRQSDARSMASKEIRGSLGLEFTDTRVAEEWSGITSFKNERNTYELLEYLQLLQSAMDEGSELNEIEKKYPDIYQELKEEAILDNQTNLAEYLEDQFDDVSNFLDSLRAYYLKQWQSARIHDLVELAKINVSLPKVPENMARYQSSLNNESYKAIRALKEAQAWRAERRLNVATTVSNTNLD